MSLEEQLRTNPYLRERLSPQPGDSLYLHLADLRIALESVRTESEIKILDYGCGFSPYRSLFPNSDYRRADFPREDGDKLDYLFSENSLVEEADSTFDLILSTQVLEHVKIPNAYLRECYRLLKPGGQLYLTTHGTYPDHACPYDFYRWTTDGLAQDISGVGFTIIAREKQTTGPRAALYHLELQLQNLYPSRRTVFGLFLFGLKSLFLRVRPRVHRMCDKHFPRNRVVTGQLELHDFYINTACLAQRP